MKDVSFAVHSVRFVSLSSPPRAPLVFLSRLGALVSVEFVREGRRRRRFRSGLVRPLPACPPCPALSFRR